MTPARRHRPGGRHGRWQRVALVCLPILSLWSPACLRAQSATADPMLTRSVSGQFDVTPPAHTSWLFNRADIEADNQLVRLNPPLLAVAAERFKTLAWEKLGLAANSPWQGRIHFVLRPADSPEDDVTITSSFRLGVWDYQVLLPDVISRNRYARALSAALLLEIANRRATPGGHAAEIPAWLVDGLAQLVLDADQTSTVLSLPAAGRHGMAVSTVNEREHGLDPLASVRVPLRGTTALTFEQLSWPTAGQLHGDDDGQYRASAELFLHALLRLPRGQANLRSLLARLPACLNWQFAFYAAWRRDFPGPRAVEKWWSLQAFEFARHDPGPRWTPGDSAAQLDALLLVPVEIRGASNSLPAHAELSLQNALRELTPAQRDPVLAARVRELELDQFQMPRSQAALAAGYAAALADFLGPDEPPRSLMNDKRAANPRGTTLNRTLRRLDALDARRRSLAARLLRPRETPSPQPPARGRGPVNLTGVHPPL